jgi:transaldolase
MQMLRRTTDPLSQLSDSGVSLWLDDLSRHRLRSGSLKELIATKRVVGVTTDPTTFQTALQDDAGYRQQISELAARGATVDDILWALMTDDVRDASDLFSAVYSRTHGVDGRVCICGDPRLAYEIDATIEQAQELFKVIERNNILITIPATLPGLHAITAAVATGISVNASLIFSLERYSAVMDAYQAGLEQAISSGHDLSQIHSVATFFPSQVDNEVDHRLQSIGSSAAEGLLSRAGIASARLAYQAYEQTFAGRRWEALAKAGARKQRPLWASTGVQGSYQDETRYVAELVAPGTATAAAECTINSVAKYGAIRGDIMIGDYTDAAEVFGDLHAIGVDLGDVFAVLETESVKRFERAWIELREAVGKHMVRQHAAYR